MRRSREFLSGAALLFRGFATWRTAPGLMILGLIPSVIVAALFTVALVILALNIENLAIAATPFADGWEHTWRDLLRGVIAVAFIIAALFLVSSTFTAATLIIGQPFYELIWRHAEAQFGELPDRAPGFWASVGSGIASGLRMLVPTALVGVALFALGLVPVAGAVLAAVLGAFVGGWSLVSEITGLPFDARGLTFRERRAALRSRRPLALGFGAAAYLLFLVPLGAIVVMPAAVAGSVLLTRRVLDEPNHVVTPAL